MLDERKKAYWHECILKVKATWIKPLASIIPLHYTYVLQYIYSTFTDLSHVGDEKGQPSAEEESQKDS